MKIPNAAYGLLSFTLFSALVFFVSIGLTLCLTGCNDYEKAEAAAGDYAQKLPGATGHVNCVPRDSDGDGYVSCSVFLKKGPPIGIECLAVPWRRGGCKVAAIRVKR